MLRPTFNLPSVKVMVGLGIRNVFSTFKFTDLFKAIILCMNWQNILTTRHNKIGSLIEKDIRLELVTLR